MKRTRVGLFGVLLVLVALANQRGLLAHVGNPCPSMGCSSFYSYCTIGERGGYASCTGCTDIFLAIAGCSSFCGDVGSPGIFGGGSDVLCICNDSGSCFEQ
jgi:hypothetical protein